MHLRLDHRIGLFAVVCSWTLSLTLGCQGTARTVSLAPPSTQAVQKSVAYLASDELEGRGMGTKGLDSAAEYIAGYFRALGLEPAPGQDDYFQHFTHTRITGLDAATALFINDRSLEQREEFQPHSLSGEGKFSGSVVFAGYGISKTQADDAGPAYDDYAGLDVFGKVVLVLRYEPHNAEGNSRLATKNQRTSDHANLPRKAKVAAEKGALALLVVHPPMHQGDESFTPAIRTGGEAMQIPVVQIKQSVAETLLKQSGAKNLQALQAEIDQSFSPRSMPLRDSHAKGEVKFERTVYKLRNITAHLPGSGKNADEFIVVGAHYDHLGRGGMGSLTPRSSEIHNGADDNASGTAAVLELARLFSQADTKPGRSLLFTLFSGEEVGLLGSKHWVDHPPVDLKKIATMINLDMVGRASDDTLIVGGSGTAASFEQMLNKLDIGSPLSIRMRTEWKNGFAPSDNTSFVLKRIPVLFFFTGQHADYHRPTDDADKINYNGLTEVIKLVSNTILELSSHTKITFTPPPPATQPTTQAFTQPSPHGGGASLGVVPDYSSDEGRDGVLISGTTPGSAAEAAGLLPNDLIVEIDGKKMANLYDLTDFLQAASPGQTITINILRNNIPTTLKATLTARRRMQ